MKKRTDKRLAEGEATGHAHVAQAEDAEVFGDGFERRLAAPTGTTISHEEHGKISLPVGNYRISRQREIDPDTEEIGSVAD